MEANSNDSKTLWIGDLDSWMDEPYLLTLIGALGYAKDLSSIKLIRDKTTGLPAKYGFIEFATHDSAQSFYQNYNNRQIQNSMKVFKLNWAAYGGITKPSSTGAKSISTQMSIYVGDLDISITEHKLLELFRAKYPSAFMSKIITDPATKISKGYGFVKFTNHDEGQKAINQMNGQNVLGKQIKVSNAFLKTKQQGVVSQQTPEQTENQMIQRQKLYTQFYSMINDPLLKAEYQRQIQKTFGVQQTGKKQTLKQSLEAVKTLTYQQTKKSEEFLNFLPKTIAYKAKTEVQARIYS